MRFGTVQPPYLAYLSSSHASIRQTGSQSGFTKSAGRLTPLKIMSGTVLFAVKLYPALCVFCYGIGVANSPPLCVLAWPYWDTDQYYPMIVVVANLVEHIAMHCSAISLIYHMYPHPSHPIGGDWCRFFKGKIPDCNHSLEVCAYRLLSNLPPSLQLGLWWFAFWWKESVP